MQTSNAHIHITWHTTPPTPAQLVAWRWLWTRPLGHTDPGPETPQPQDHRGTGATNFAAVASGSHIVSERDVEPEENYGGA